MGSFPRIKSESGIYHVILRGNGRQLIFEDDADRLRFLDSLRRFKKASPVEIHAYCLMDNHVHLLLREGETDCALLESFMRRLDTGYAKYFNLRHDRVGSLFQGRFLSEAVKDDAQYMVTLRYIHQNPQKTGMSTASGYRWSSFREYARAALLEGFDSIDKDSEGIVDIDFAVDMFDGAQELVRYVLKGSDDECMDVDVAAGSRSCRVEELLAALAKEGADGGRLKAMPRSERNEVLRRLLVSGFSIREIERATGIGRGIIQRVAR